MKKTYVTPDVEKVAFQYRDQVVAASNIPGTVCTQSWVGLGSHEAGASCHYETVVKDSGF
ncbi:MAG: hypothetical protein IJE17_01625 [Clostridia bacterium]|nr:hypothetical protein [Clostridia bacterium]